MLEGNEDSLVQSRPFDLLVSPFWTICCHVRKRLTFFFNLWALWPTEKRICFSWRLALGAPWNAFRQITDLHGTESLDIWPEADRQGPGCLGQDRGGLEEKRRGSPEA